MKRGWFRKVAEKEDKRGKIRESGVIGNKEDDSRMNE